MAGIESLLQAAGGQMGPPKPSPQQWLQNQISASTPTVFDNRIQTLSQKNTQTPQLLELMALQKMLKEKQAAERSLQMAQNTVPSTIKDQRAAQVFDMTKREVAQQVAPGLAIMGQRMAQARPPAPQNTGIAQLPAPNMTAMADGGVVPPPKATPVIPRPIPRGQPNAAAQAGATDDVSRFLYLYSQYQASSNAAQTPQEKAQVEARWNADKNTFNPDTVAKAFQILDGQKGFQHGGAVRRFDGGGTILPSLGDPMGIIPGPVEMTYPARIALEFLAEKGIDAAKYTASELEQLGRSIISEGGGASPQERAPAYGTTQRPGARDIVRSAADTVSNVRLPDLRPSSIDDRTGQAENLMGIPRGIAGLAQDMWNEFRNRERPARATAASQERARGISNEELYASQGMSEADYSPVPKFISSAVNYAKEHPVETALTAASLALPASLGVRGLIGAGKVGAKVLPKVARFARRRPFFTTTAATAPFLLADELLPGEGGGGETSTAPASSPAPASSQARAAVSTGPTGQQDPRFRQGIMSGIPSSDTGSTGPWQGNMTVPAPTPAQWLTNQAGRPQGRAPASEYDRLRAQYEQLINSEPSQISKLTDFLLGAGASGGTNLGATLTGAGTGIRNAAQQREAQKKEAIAGLMGLEKDRELANARLAQGDRELDIAASQLGLEKDKLDLLKVQYGNEAAAAILDYTAKIAQVNEGRAKAIMDFVQSDMGAMIYQNTYDELLRQPKYKGNPLDAEKAASAALINKAIEYVNAASGGGGGGGAMPDDELDAKLTEAGY